MNKERPVTMESNGLNYPRRKKSFFDLFRWKPKKHKISSPLDTTEKNRSSFREGNGINAGKSSFDFSFELPPDNLTSPENSVDVSQVRKRTPKNKDNKARCSERPVSLVETSNGGIFGWGKKKRQAPPPPSVAPHTEDERPRNRSNSDYPDLSAHRGPSNLQLSKHISMSVPFLNDMVLEPIEPDVQLMQSIREESALSSPLSPNFPSNDTKQFPNKSPLPIRNFSHADQFLVPFPKVKRPLPTLPSLLPPPPSYPPPSNSPQLAPHLRHQQVGSDEQLWTLKSKDGKPRSMVRMDSSLSRGEDTEESILKNFDLTLDEYDVSSPTEDLNRLPEASSSDDANLVKAQYLPSRQQVSNPAERQLIITMKENHVNSDAESDVDTPTTLRRVLERKQLHQNPPPPKPTKTKIIKSRSISMQNLQPINSGLDMQIIDISDRNYPSTDSTDEVEQINQSASFTDDLYSPQQLTESDDVFHRNGDRWESSHLGYGDYEELTSPSYSSSTFSSPRRNDASLSSTNQTSTSFSGLPNQFSPIKSTAPSSISSSLHPRHIAVADIDIGSQRSSVSSSSSNTFSPPPVKPKPKPPQKPKTNVVGSTFKPIYD